MDTRTAPESGLNAAPDCVRTQVPAAEAHKPEVASLVIDALGGTVATSRLCEVSSQSVSQWRQRGIPRSRVMFLRLLRPELFETAG